MPIPYRAEPPLKLRASPGAQGVVFLILGLAALVAGGVYFASRPSATAPFAASPPSSAADPHIAAPAAPGAAINQDTLADVFAAASKDQWSSLRNAQSAKIAQARISEAGDAVLVTSRELDYFCGAHTEGCDGGRIFILIGRPGVLPGKFTAAAPMDSKVPAVLSFDDGRATRTFGNDLTSGVTVAGQLVLQLPPKSRAFEFDLDYRDDAKTKRVETRLHACRSMTIAVEAQTFRFACAGLRAAEQIP
jgi:hypothetical protein